MSNKNRDRKKRNKQIAPKSPPHDAVKSLPMVPTLAVEPSLLTTSVVQSAQQAINSTPVNAKNGWWKRVFKYVFVPPGNIWELSALLSVVATAITLIFIYNQYQIQKLDYDLKTGRTRSSLSMFEILPHPSQIDDRKKIPFRDGNTMVKVSDLKSLIEIGPHIFLGNPGSPVDSLKLYVECVCFGELDQVPKDTLRLLDPEYIQTDFIVQKIYEPILPRKIDQHDACDINMTKIMVEMIRVKCSNVDRSKDKFITIKVKAHARLAGSTTYDESPYIISARYNCVVSPAKFFDGEVDTFLKETQIIGRITNIRQGPTTNTIFQ